MANGGRRSLLILSFIPLLALFAGASYAVSYCTTLVYDLFVSGSKKRNRTAITAASDAGADSLTPDHDTVQALSTGSYITSTHPASTSVARGIDEKQRTTAEDADSPQRHSDHEHSFEVEDYDDDTVVIYKSVTHRASFFENNIDALTMWTCRKCQKPVYFAERKTSLGYDWHPECLRCEECGKRVNPGQHAEHKGQPFCYIPCYSVLFGPTLYGHGSRVESHQSFGAPKMSTPHGVDRQVLETKLKEYNQYYESKMPSNVIKCRERNGKLILEGSLRVFWDIGSSKLHLKEEDDDRLSVRRSVRRRKQSDNDDQDDDAQDRAGKNENATKTSPSTLSPTDSSDSSPTDESTSTSSPESQLPSPEDIGRTYKTLPTGGITECANNEKLNGSRATKSFDDEYVMLREKSNGDSLSATSATSTSEMESKTEDGVTLRRKAKSKIRRSRLLRRCSINGHYYDRETSVFTPATGSVTSVWVSSLVTTSEVVNMLLDKFKVTNEAADFAIYVIRDNGECRRLQDQECPLVVRVLLGPSEDVAKVYVMSKPITDVSAEVAQFINLSEVELRLFLKKFEEEESKEILRLRRKYDNVRKYIKIRIKELEG